MRDRRRRVTPAEDGQAAGDVAPVNPASDLDPVPIAGEAQTVVEIKRMTARDVPDVATVDRECFPTHWNVQSYRNELANPAATYFVARHAGTVVGFAGMWVGVDEAHITMLAVLPQYRQRGIATVLLAELLLQARRFGCRSATLEVRESNTVAQHLYQRFGFENGGTRRRYYTDTNEDAYILWVRDLDSDEYGQLLERLKATAPCLVRESASNECGVPRRGTT